jgi:hypothetical protein
MNDDGPVNWVVMALIVVAIVLLAVFARGPEEQEHSLAPTPVVVELAA